MADVLMTNCVSAGETQQVYQELVEAELHGQGQPPCLRDDCEHCAPLNALVEIRGDECDDRGCTLSRCIYDT